MRFADVSSNGHGRNPQVVNQFRQIAVTATAKEFAGIYRGKQCHPPDFIYTLDRALTAGVEKVMLTGMSLSDVPFNLNIAKTRPSQCRITIGIHPYHANEPEEEGSTHLHKLAETVNSCLAQQPKLVSAFGELGLDYDRLNHASKEVQMRTFKAQLDIFVENEWRLPLFLHCRAAFHDFVSVMRPYISKLPRRGVVHSFVGTERQMRTLLSLGLDVSVNGFSFQSEESLAMVAAIPLDRLHIETDAPWGEIKPSSQLAKAYLDKVVDPVGSKKKDKWHPDYMVKERNESCTIHRVACVVAGLKGVSVEAVADAAWQNSTKMFGFEEIQTKIEALT